MAHKRIFLGHFVSPDYAKKLGISVAASNFSTNLLKGSFDKSYSILPVFVQGKLDSELSGLDNAVLIYSNLRKLTAPFNKIAPIFEQLQLFFKIPNNASLWLYNVTLLNRLLIWLLRLFRPSVQIYPIVLDYTPGSSTAETELKIINQSLGRISLSYYSDISKVNTRCLPGIAPLDSNEAEMTMLNRSFLLSGVLLEQISLLSIVVQAFKSIPEATLYITGNIESRPDLKSIITDTPNVKVLGNLDRDEYLTLLNSVTFVLSTRDINYPENYCNFPSKIIEGLLHNRIVISTIHYPQLGDIKYFKISGELESMIKDLRLIMSKPDSVLKNYANQSHTVKKRFSPIVWDDCMTEIERPYDFVFLTNTPSFYKLNLCNELALRGVKLLVVFNGYGAEAVNKVLSESNQFVFDWIFLHEGDYWKRPKFTTFNRLRKLLKHIRYKKLIFSGWMSMEYNLYSFFSPKKKNVMICESSKFEVDTTGLKGWVKRRIIGRMSAMLPSGKPHKELLESLGFKGPQYITGSVGIFNMNKGADNPDALSRIERVKKSGAQFLYVGRLTDVKNLSLLIECFNKNGLPLTLAGDGELMDSLKAMAGPNISFLGFIENENLARIYNQHDVFILPSKSETWGLVVEEALFRGLPAIVSDVVGSGPDMVLETGAGVTFAHDSAESLQEAIDKVIGNYAEYATAASAIDFDKRKHNQVEAYINVLNS